MSLIGHFSESVKCRCYQFQTQNGMQIEYYKDQNYLWYDQWVTLVGF